MSVSSMPESGVASPSTLPGRCERSRADASVHRRRLAVVARRSTTAAAPSLGEHSIQRCSGSHTSRDASTSSAVTSLRNIAFGLCTPWRRFFTTTSARWSLVRPGSRSSRWARSAKYAGVAASPASSRHGSKNDERMMPFGIFSMPNTSTQSYWPARIAPAASCSAAPPLAQPGLDVDDRHAGARERAEHLVARRDARRTRCRRTRPGTRGLPASASAARTACTPMSVFGDAVEAAERMDADAGDLDRGHARARTPT